jgi:exodeoxyribonuclease VII large subunit
MGTNFFDFREQVTQRQQPASARRKPTTVKPLAGGGSGGAGGDAMTVSQLTAQIDRTLKAGFPAPLLVRGEVSNYRPNPSSGHVYFTLKDAGACVNCVMWKSDAVQLRFAPSDGMELLARGAVQVYAQQGKYQLYVSSLQPLGKGALELAFQQMRATLEAEGLFAPERKRPLPRFPTRLVLVTSSQTAALQDMLKVLRRFPWVRLYVYHVPVQGDGCGQRIAAGLLHLNRSLAAIGGADVILLGRGGGSLEDLWGFNEEAVARAVAASGVPVVTGIGHEVDTSIADLVADYHAHTPTEAAQVVTAHWRGARDAVDFAAVRLGRGLRTALQHARQRLIGCERHEVFRRPLYRVNALRQLVDDRERVLAGGMDARVGELQRRLQAMASVLDRNPPSVMLARQRARLGAFEQRLIGDGVQRVRRHEEAVSRLAARLGERHPRNELRLGRQRLDHLASRLRHGIDLVRDRERLRLDALARYLEALSPEHVLRRGYSITTRKRDGAIVRSPDDVRVGETIVTRVAEGEISSVIDDAKQPRLFE